MTEHHQDQLRETFEKYSQQTPDPAAVYARVEELAGKYKRRRRGAYVAGGAVLGAGLIAGVLNLPSVLPAGPGTQGNATLPAAAPAVSPSVSGTPSEADLKKYWNAYFGAGYGYNDALKLAKIWKLGTGDVGSVKAEAGRRLLLGETLPVQPSPDPVESGPSEAEIQKFQKQLDAFFNAGYTWDEAEKLAKIWKIGDPSDAKVEAGKRLLAGETLPVQPTADNVQAAKEAQQVEAFFKKGYDFADAEKLAKLWKISTSEAKAEAGKRLLAGQTLPIQP
ncbi:hypothetical protein Ade02nite_81230 [Paractinoplanes deccanensis]|uniref:Uncharacterized protein n=1 Tax=Paractinoplanes deccanensis TaxID=113561 RepID=A0ABQ3YHM3_9ACTN|nr:hypothetical protein [Actinoplanes deccanensis]GID79482.1 hypothetical protein Ade02nite_81230 [Actinoplanes deccanensis]